MTHFNTKISFLVDIINERALMEVLIVKFAMLFIKYDRIEEIFCLQTNIYLCTFRKRFFEQKSAKSKIKFLILFISYPFTLGIPFDEWISLEYVHSLFFLTSSSFFFVCILCHGKQCVFVCRYDNKHLLVG